MWFYRSHSCISQFPIFIAHSTTNPDILRAYFDDSLCSFGYNPFKIFQLYSAGSSLSQTSTTNRQPFSEYANTKMKCTISTRNVKIISRMVFYVVCTSRTQSFFISLIHKLNRNGVHRKTDHYSPSDCIWPRQMYRRKWHIIISWNTYLVFCACNVIHCKYAECWSCAKTTRKI